VADRGFDLRLEPYCAYCPNFEPDVEKIDVTVAIDKTQRVLTTIRCEHRNVCERVSQRIKEVENG